MQFDKKSIFDMHLSIVHKERIEIKEEQIMSLLSERTGDGRVRNRLFAVFTAATSDRIKCGEVFSTFYQSVNTYRVS